MRHSEYNEQCAYFLWARMFAKNEPRLKYAFSMQSGEKFKSALAGARAKKAGMLAGIPDIFIPCPIGKYAGLWIELKRKIVKGEAKPTVSQSQKEALEYLNGVGYKAIVCYGADEAINATKSYLKGE